VVIALLAELAAVRARAGDKPQSLTLGIAPSAGGRGGQLSAPESPTARRPASPLKTSGKD
jgi:hypothetical protein